MALGLKGNEHYRAFIDNLVEANVDRHIELPMIAVMGDTSSGTYVLSPDDSIHSVATSR